MDPHRGVVVVRADRAVLTTGNAIALRHSYVGQGPTVPGGGHAQAMVVEM